MAERTKEWFSMYNDILRLLLKISKKTLPIAKHENHTQSRSPSPPHSSTLHTKTIELLHRVPLRPLAQVINHRHAIASGPLMQENTAFVSARFLPWLRPPLVVRPFAVELGAALCGVRGLDGLRCGDEFPCGDGGGGEEKGGGNFHFGMWWDRVLKDMGCGGMVW